MWGYGSLTPKPLGGLADVVQIALNAGDFNDTGCAVDVRGDAWCWGGNSKGQCGTGEATGLPLERPAQVEGLGPVAWIAVGQAHTATCAALRSGKAYCWGEGLLTGPTSTSSVSPVQLERADILKVQPLFQRVCTHHYGRGVTCWGTPALIDDETSGPAQIPVGNVVSLEGGLYQTCTLDTGGDLRCWNAATSPSSVDPGVKYIAVSILGAMTYALKADGTINVWNMNSATPKAEPSKTVKLW